MCIEVLQDHQRSYTDNYTNMVSKSDSKLPKVIFEVKFQLSKKVNFQLLRLFSAPLMSLLSVNLYPLLEVDLKLADA